MMRIFKFILFLKTLVISNVWATIDLSALSLYRTKPIAGGIQVDGGKNFVLWGDPKQTTLYGYTRVGAKLFTAATYNEPSLSLKFFPLSFLGAEVGAGHIWNSSDYKDYDCTAFDCETDASYKYFQIVSLIGFGPVFAKIVEGQKNLENKSTAKEFIYPKYGSALSRNGDTVRFREIQFGFKHWKFVFAHELKKATVDDFSGTHRVNALVVALNGVNLTNLTEDGPVTYFVSYGNFSSEQFKRENYVAVGLKIDFYEGVSLD